MIRNYIAKLNYRLRELTDETNKSYLEYLFNTVSCVHTSKKENDFVFSKSDRSIVLTIYMSLIEYKVVSED